MFWLAARRHDRGGALTRIPYCGDEDLLRRWC
jgi:hypothetical protein